MNHDLNNKNSYPKHHLFLSSNNINLYTQGISVIIGDTIQLNDKCYKITEVRQENVLLHKGTKTTVNNYGDEYNYELSRPYVKKNTKFFSIRYEGEPQFQMTQDKHRIGIMEFNIPKNNRNRYAI